MNLSVQEDYMKKAKDIFKMINDFRKNPKNLAKHLEGLKKHLDKNSNVLSEPGKIQVQMVEGERVFNETIDFLLSLHYLKPFEWDDNLALSAIEHVLDIGPKGLLSYQSSDGTEPEERITKYGNYVEALGENIDFGPNDAIGVIISLTLDDGEPDRPHRDNLFKADYQKVGIACGPHKTEYQMCVMDFAYDFLPFNDDSEVETTQTVNVTSLTNKNLVTGLSLNNKPNSAFTNEDILNQNNFNHQNGYRDRDDNLSGISNITNSLKGTKLNDMDLFIDPKATATFSTSNKLSKDYSQETKKTFKNEDTFGSYGQPHLNNLINNNQSQTNQNVHNSPLVRLSLDNMNIEELKAKEREANNNNQNAFTLNQNIAQVNNLQGTPIIEEDSENYIHKIKAINSGKKVVSKLVEVTTKIVYTYDDGSTREVTEKINNLFNGDN